MFRTRRIILTLATATVLLAVGPIGLPQMQPNGEPCDGNCHGELPACQNSWQPYASAVFLGRASEVHEVDVPIKGEKAHTEKLLVTFRVDEAFIGVSDKVVIVSSGGDFCGFPFSEGHSYLIYARRLPNGQLYVSTCYGTKLASDATDDLKYLRGLPNAPHGATILGSAVRYTEPERMDSKVRLGAPETGHKVEIRGAAKSFQAIVDKRGDFKVGGLPPGRYTISLDTQEEVHTYPPVRSTTVDIADKGCAQFNFWIDPFVKKEQSSPPLSPPGTSRKQSN